jgi:hypothetical protein
MMPGILLIYGLRDPRTGEIRYVGKSTNGLVRPRVHAHPSEIKRPSRKNNWIQSLKKQGLRYEIVILEYVNTLDELPEAECRWIAFGRQALGDRLTNLLDGGGSLGRKLAVETRQRIAEKVRAIAQTPAGRAHLLAIGEKAKSPEARAKISAKARARPLTPARLLQLRAAALQSRRAETRAKISASLKGRVLSAIHRERISDANRRRYAR